MNYFWKNMQLLRGQKYRYMMKDDASSEMSDADPIASIHVYPTDISSVTIDIQHGIYIGDSPCGKFHLMMCNHPKELSIQIKYIRPEMILSWVDDIQMSVLEVEMLHKYILQSMDCTERDSIPCLYLDFFAYSRYRNQIPKFMVKPLPLCM